MDINTAKKTFEQALTLQLAGDYVRASQIYIDLIKAFPERESIATNLSACFISLNDYSSAGKLLPALINSESSDGLLNAGTILMRKRDYHSAIELFTKSYKINKAETVIRSLAIAETKIGNYEKAASLCDELYSITQDTAELGRRDYYFASACQWAKLLIEPAQPAFHPFYDILKNTSEETTYISAKYAAEKQAIEPRKINRKLNKKLKIAYLSGEFREHATTKLLINILENHDHDRFEFFLLDNGYQDDSRYSERISNCGIPLIKIEQHSDAEAASIIAELKIDIIVNLNGYFGLNRLRLLFSKPSPIVINYLGFPGTVGHESHDFIIADRVVIDEVNSPYFSENVLFMPHCYQPTDSLRPLPDKSLGRPYFGLTDEAFYFCSFNNNSKITKVIAESWARILRNADEAKLVLLSDNHDAKTNLQQFFADQSVSSQIIFFERFPTDQYLGLLSCCDLFLDTFPCNAHTTAADAIFSGLPVLTLKGSTFASRVASSILKNIDEKLEQTLIATSIDEYTLRAISLYKNQMELMSIKSIIDESRQTAPYFDSKAYTRDLENLFAKAVTIHRTNDENNALSINQ